MLKSPEKLRKIRDSLSALTVHEMTHAQMEALAECCFRIAVLKSTPYAEAVSLLSEAMRFDSANPKHAFHLGRIHYLHDDFDKAQKAFLAAYQMVPSNHRIWSAYAQMQWEMEKRHQGRKNYIANSLGNRADRIVTQILDGKDAVPADDVKCEPAYVQTDAAKSAKAGDKAKIGEQAADGGQAKPAAADKPRKRYTNAGQTRNHGVLQLQLEQILAMPPTKLSIKKGLFYLGKIAALPQENARRSMFSLAAVQWLLRGYPLSPIREFLHGDPALESALTSAVIDVFSREYPENLEKLASCVNGHTIPELTGSMIHRALARHLECDIAAPYHICHARQYVAAKENLQSDNQTLDLISALCVIIRKLDVPVFSLAEHREELQLDADTALEGIDKLAAEIAAMEEWKKSLFDVYKNMAAEAKKISAEGAGYAAFCHKYEKAKALLEAMREKVEAARALFMLCVKSCPTAVRVEKQDEHLALKNRYDDVLAGQFPRFAKMIERALSKSCDPQETDDRTLLDLQDALRTMFLWVDSVQPSEDDPSPQEEKPSGEDALDAAKLPRTAETIRSLLSRIEETLEDRYTRSIGLLDAYDQPIRGGDAFEKLYYQYTFSYAMLLLRMNRPMEARAHFTRLKQRHPMDTAVARNLAVFDSLYAGDTAQSAAAWENYIELLYVYAVSIDDMRIFAQERYQYHRTLAVLYNPCDCFIGRDETSEDRAASERKAKDGTYDAQMKRFLAAPQKAYHFCANLLLMYLNKLFTYQTPYAMLAVSDADSSELRKAALKQLLALNRAVRAFYPARVRAAAEAAVERHFDSVCRQCAQEAKLNTIDPKTIKDEKLEYVAFMMTVIKAALYLLVRIQKMQEDAPWDMEVALFLFTLSKLPLPADSELTQIFSGQFRPDVGMHLKTLENTSKQRLSDAAAALYAQTSDPKKAASQERQYRHILKSLEHSGLMRELGAIAAAIPKGANAGFDRILALVNEGRAANAGDREIELLKQMSRRYSRSYEPAFLLCKIYAAKDKMADAAYWMKQAEAAAISDEVRQQMSQQGAQFELRVFSDSISDEIRAIQALENPEEIKRRCGSLLSDIDGKIKGCENEKLKDEYQKLRGQVAGMQNNLVVRAEFSKIMQAIKTDNQAYQQGKMDTQEMARALRLNKAALESLKSKIGTQNGDSADFAEAIDRQLENVNRFLESCS